MYIVVLDKVQNCLGKCIKKLYFPSLKTNLTILSTVFLKYAIKLKENFKYFKIVSLSDQFLLCIKTVIVIRKNSVLLFCSYIYFIVF